MDAVDVVSFHDIHDDGEGALAGEAAGGIHPFVGFEITNNGGMGAGDVSAGGGDVFIGEGAEGVEPGVNLDAAGVGLLDAVGEGIVAG